MVEPARRERVPTDDRGNPTRQWDVFCRDEPGAPLRHVGSVAAASETEAHEHASRLFARYAVDVWVCPADAIARFSTRRLEATADEAEGERDERDDANDSGEESTGEPRVTEP